MLRKIKLHGELRDRYGAEFDLNVRSPAEAVQALCANFPKLKQELLTDKTGYIVKVEDKSLKVDDLTLPVGGMEAIHIIPHIEGSGRNPYVNIIIGALLIWSGVGAGAGSHLMSAGVGAFVSQVGVGLILMGVSNLLFAPSEKEKDIKDKNTPSYQFNGVVNTVKEGYPVPIGYGELIVGSAIISGGLNVHEF